MDFKRVGGLSVLVGALAVSLSVGQAQDKSSGDTDRAAKAASILAESRKAIGGDDKLGAIKTLEIKGTARRSATDMNLEGDMTIVMELPGRYLRKESILLGNAGIDIVEGLNGSGIYRADHLIPEGPVDLCLDPFQWDVANTT